MKKFLSVALAVCILLSISVTAFALEGDGALPRMPRCPQCNNGYISSSSISGSWISEGPTSCQHGKMGTDDKQYRKVTTTTKCDMRCGFGRTIESTQNRLICRGY